MRGADPIGTPARQSRLFLALYALAAAGGAVAYVPFLTLLLPSRLSALEGAGDVAAVARLAFVGALAASAAHIVFGWASDVSGRRRPWIGVGLVLSCALLVAMGRAESLPALAALLVAWQAALNMMLAPLAAWAGDCVPANQRGKLGGLLSLSPAVGAAAGALVTSPGLVQPYDRPMAVVAMVVMLVVPALVFARPQPIADAPSTSPGVRRSGAPARKAMLVMWLARLLVQIAEAALFAYLLFWFRTIDESFGPDRVALLFSMVLAGSIPVALGAGWWSDRHRSPALPLAALAALGSVALLAMAAARGLAEAIVAYLGFGLASGAFLALHSAQTLGVLPDPRRRGRDLGIFNLTNTVPSLIMPWLALGLVPAFGFSALFLCLAVLAVGAAALLLWLARL